MNEINSDVITFRATTQSLFKLVICYLIYSLQDHFNFRS